MTREGILAEIRMLERQKETRPDLAREINEQITALCDQLKSLRDSRRKGIL